MMTQQRLRVTAGVLGALVVGLAGACGYQYVAAFTATRAITAQHSDLKAIKQQADERVKAQENRAQLIASVAQRPVAWSWSEQLPIAVAQLTDFTEPGGIRLETLQPSPAVERQQIARFPLRATLRTDLSSLVELLQFVQGAEPVLAVDHLTMRAGQQVGEPLQVEMTLSSYVMTGSGQAAGGQP